MYFPQSFIICSHFQGVMGRIAIAAKDCHGSLLMQVEDAISFALSQLNQQFKIVKVKRQQHLEISEVALPWKRFGSEVCEASIGL